MSTKIVSHDGFRIEVNRPGSPPAEDAAEEYLKSRNLDGAWFFRTQKDDHPVAFAQGPEASQTRLEESMQQVLVDDLTSGLLDALGDIDINITL